MSIIKRRITLSDHWWFRQSCAYRSSFGNNAWPLHLPFLTWYSTYGSVAIQHTQCVCTRVWYLIIVAEFVWVQILMRMTFPWKSLSCLYFRMAATGINSGVCYFDVESSALMWAGNIKVHTSPNFSEWLIWKSLLEWVYLFCELDSGI